MHYPLFLPVFKFLKHNSLLIWNSILIGATGALMLFIDNPNGKAFEIKNIEWIDDENIVKERIVGIFTPASKATGTIIGKKGNTYAILTAGHVIPSLQKGDEYDFYSLSSKKQYKITSVEYPLGKKIDIAVATFNSPEDHKITIINRFYDWNIQPLDSIAQYWGIHAGGGLVTGVSLPSRSITVPIIRFDGVGLRRRAYGNKDGYEMIYKSSTVPGMSGGPVLGPRFISCQNKDHEIFGNFTLLGIHGRSEEYYSGGRSGISLGIPIDLIKDYLIDNSKRLGIPVTKKEIQEIINSQYCG